MTTIVLTRHGHVEGIQPERFRGRAELALTPLGQRQAQATADYIAAGWRPAAVYCSPMDRCVRTASAIAQPFGLHVERVPGLNDFDYGLWQGLTIADVQARWPAEYALWRSAPQQLTVPGGESLYNVAARAIRDLHEILQRHKAETVVIVAHDSVNRILLMHMLDMPMSHYRTLVQAPCAISIVDFKDGLFTVRSCNDDRHCPQS